MAAKSDKLDTLLDALVDHATRHGGDVTAILDAQAGYKGEQTNAEKAAEENDKAAAEQEAGKAANAKQVEDEKAAKGAPGGDKS